MLDDTTDPAATASVVDQIHEQWTRALEIWSSGGWAMWVLATIALVMFGMGVHVWLRLGRTGFAGMRESTWRAMVENPEEREGPVGEIIQFVTRPDTIEGTRDFFRQVEKSETGPFSRDLRIMKVCVSAAPLVGLLGTVTGMLATFDALAVGSGGDKTMGMVASGISEALVTTETGLVVALPGVFFQYHLMRKFEHYKVFLAQLETVCIQQLHQRLGRRRSTSVQRTALLRIADSLQRAVS